MTFTRVENFTNYYILVLVTFFCQRKELKGEMWALKTQF